MAGLDMYNIYVACQKINIIKYIRGCGGIGIHARLRGVFFTEYGFKSRQPHQHEKASAINKQGLFSALTKSWLY